MPCFAMICSCSMLLSYSKHCFLMLNSWHVVIFTKSVTSIEWISCSSVSIFCQASWVVPAMCFVVLLECCSLLFLMHLDGLVLLIADRCHMCFACHLQTMHPIPVIFISISTEINSSFQRRTWFAKLRHGSIFSFRSPHMHCIAHPAYHAMFCIMLLAHCTVVDCCFLFLCSCLG